MSTLNSPPHPLPLLPTSSTYTTTTPTHLQISCRDRLFRDISVFDATSRTALFRVTAPGILQSWSLRRNLIDAKTDAHILDFRHYSLDAKNRWKVEDADGKAVASIEHVKQLTSSHSAVDATVYGVRDGKDTVVEMRPCDDAALKCTVGFEGAVVAEIRLVADNDITFNEARGKDRTSWEVDIAEGVDLTLIMVMMLCRAEMSHIWRQ